jgi:hypothetical protein
MNYQIGTTREPNRAVVRAPSLINGWIYAARPGESAERRRKGTVSKFRMRKLVSKTFLDFLRLSSYCRALPA